MEFRGINKGDNGKENGNYRDYRIYLFIDGYYIGIMKKKMETTMVQGQGYILGIMENGMETSIIGLYRVYRVCGSGVSGIDVVLCGTEKVYS